MLLLGASAAIGIVSCSSEDVEAPPAPPDRLAFSSAPVRVVAGVPFDPAVQVVIRRMDGAVDVGSTAAVSIVSQSLTVADTLRGSTTVTAVAGIATFPGVSLARVSTDTRLFARAGGLTGAESALIRVVPGEPAQLVFLTQPASAVAGQPLAAIRVQLRDAAGNRVQSASGAVTIAISTGPAGAVITGAVTVDLDLGEASLTDVRLPRAGTGYTLTASVVGNSAVRSPITRVFSNLPGAASELAFVAEPTVTVVGATIAPAVRVAIFDSFGNTVTGAVTAVTLDLAVAPVGAQLLGTTSVTPAAGVATFSNIRVDRSSANVRLRATAPGMSPAISAIFAVGAP